MINIRKIKLSIIIITLNEEKNIANLLSDLKKQTFQDFEIIVSDSNSQDRTEEVVRGIQKYIPNLSFKNCGRTLGPAYGRNYGVTFAHSERLLFLDADTRLKSTNFLDSFINKVTYKKADVGSMYPIIETDNILISTINLLMNFGMFITQFVSPTGVGACMFSTKAVHNKIGGFREDIKLCEDSDYMRDAFITGFKVKMISLEFLFSDRRFKQYGIINTNLKYLKANLMRFMTGRSITEKHIEYTFGNYNQN